MEVAFKRLIKQMRQNYLERVALVVKVFYRDVVTSLCAVAVGLAQLARPSLGTRKEQILGFGFLREIKGFSGSLSQF